jgi:uncharacterized protein (TIGR02246 family)
MFGHNTLGIPMDNSLFTHPSPQKAIQFWLDTLCQHDPEAVVNLYIPEGVLLGTLAENIKYGRPEIRTYFDTFVTKKPCGVITSMSSVTYDSVAVVNGTYLFELEENGESLQVPARFTFVLVMREGGWLIDTHHSSAQP